MVVTRKLLARIIIGFASSILGICAYLGALTALRTVGSNMPIPPEIYAALGVMSYLVWLWGGIQLTKTNREIIAAKVIKFSRKVKA